VAETLEMSKGTILHHFRSKDRLLEQVERGQFAPADPAIVSLQIFGMCNWSWTWYRPDGAWSADDIAESFTATLFRGLAVSRRVKLSPAVPGLVRTTMERLG
jgi:TetR/AcrR family transcriptional regulator, cholesterol catabolism regulator